MKQTRFLFKQKIKFKEEILEVEIYDIKLMLD
jgi:hypothetical protein